MSPSETPRPPSGPNARFGRWLYRGARPSRLARAMNRVAAFQFGAGLLTPRRGVTLDVRGRRTGRVVSFPLVLVERDGERYLVSMLGNDANWVHNLRAADGRAVLRHRGSEDVHLDLVDLGERAPILRQYLALAPGARPHFPLDRRAPLEDFERIAADYPVFRVTTVG